MRSSEGSASPEPVWQDTRAEGRGPQQHEIVCGAVTVRYERRLSARRRRLQLRVTPEGTVVVEAPATTSAGEITAFVTRHCGWVLRQLGRLLIERERDGEPPLTAPRAYVTGAVVPFLGEPQRLVVEVTPFARSRIVQVDATLRVSIPGSTPAAERSAYVRSILEQWFVAQAGKIIGERVQAINERLGARVARVTIKDTRSRWGSCSANGNLNFSWRLVMAPTHVLEYLVAHELAHLRHMNHGPRFWEQVAALCVEWRSARVWLKRHGHTLRL